jgi:hypothetical protein
LFGWFWEFLYVGLEIILRAEINHLFIVPAAVANLPMTRAVSGDYSGAP